jgi:hypothetical protein
MHFEGRGFAKDFRKAIRCLRTGALKGSVEAQITLGDLYFVGNGLEQDYGEAANWYQLAAEQGDSEAQCILADMYRTGVGVRQDYEQAARWYRKAAQEDDRDAQSELADLLTVRPCTSEDEDSDENLDQSTAHAELKVHRIWKQLRSRRAK